MGRMANKVKEESTARTSTFEIPVRERRPFLFLNTVAVPRALPESAAAGIHVLNARVDGEIATLVRSLVNHTVSVQNDAHRRQGRPVGVSLSVLNRRRRAARAWIVTILRGQVDRATLHAVAHSWLPQLCGTGPRVADAMEPARGYFEFLRGLITAHILSEPAANLLPEAKALHALESVLGIHLQAMEESIREEAARESLA